MDSKKKLDHDRAMQLVGFPVRVASVGSKQHAGRAMLVSVDSRKRATIKPFGHRNEVSVSIDELMEWDAGVKEYCETNGVKPPPKNEEKPMQARPKRIIEEHRETTLRPKPGNPDQIVVTEKPREVDEATEGLSPAAKIAVLANRLDGMREQWQAYEAEVAEAKAEIETAKALVEAAEEQLEEVHSRGDKIVRRRNELKAELERAVKALS